MFVKNSESSMLIDPKQLSVTLMIRHKNEGKWSRTTVTYGRTGRVVPGLIILNGKELRLEDVAYELRYYANGQACYVPAGKNASDAEEMRRVLAAQLSAKAIAQAAGVAVVETPNRKRLRAWKQEYIDKKSVLVGDDQLKRIKYVIELFMESCSKTYLDELDQSDFINFLRLLSTVLAFRSARKAPSKRSNAVQRRRRLPTEHRPISKRTIFSYFISMRAWLCEGGVDRKIFPPPPKYEEVEVTIYTPQEIEAFFALVQGNLRIATSLMLKCGLRRKEVAYAYFSDINFENKTILVRGKPEFGFRVKNRIQRHVPVPDDLLDELRQWEQDHPGQMLITAGPKGRPELHLIQKLKRFAYLHGLRCGRCSHCRAGNPECEEWELHKFRRSYISPRSYGMLTFALRRHTPGIQGSLQLNVTSKPRAQLKAKSECQLSIGHSRSIAELKAIGVGNHLF
jgi:integrase